MYIKTGTATRRVQQRLSVNGAVTIKEQKSLYVNGVAIIQSGSKYVATAERVSLENGHAHYQVYISPNIRYTAEDLTRLIKRLVYRGTRYEYEKIKVRSYDVEIVKFIKEPQLTIFKK